jgi:hypothetical protein
MKRLLIAIVAFLSVSTALFSQNANTKLLVYQFHMTIRCHTCATIEEVTIQTLDSFYRAQLDSNIIVFKSFDCELGENADLVKKYTAYGSTLALTALLPEGKEIVVDITDMAFQKIGKKELFVEKLREKIDEMLSLQ